MQTLGRQHGTSENASSMANILMNVDQKPLPVSTSFQNERRQVTQRPSPQRGGQVFGAGSRHRRSRSIISTDELSQLSQMARHKSCPPGQIDISQTSTNYPEVPAATLTHSQTTSYQANPKNTHKQKPPLDLSNVATKATNT